MKTTIKTIFYVTLAGYLLFSVGCARKEESKDVAEDVNEERFDDRKNEKDAQFVVDLVASSYDEIKLAQVAQEKSTSADVKSLAKMLENDHTAAINDLKGLASAKGISIPMEASEDAVKKADDLRDEEVKDFDKKWVDELADRHEKTINKLEKVISDATDPEIQTWASNNISKIRMHLDQLKAKEEQLEDRK